MIQLRSTFKCQAGKENLCRYTIHFQGTFNACANNIDEALNPFKRLFIEALMAFPLRGKTEIGAGNLK
jgi:hypothetical protein